MESPGAAEAASAEMMSEAKAARMVPVSMTVNMGVDCVGEASAELKTLNQSLRALYRAWDSVLHFSSSREQNLK
jgi:hypothetical protein